MDTFQKVYNHLMPAQTARSRRFSRENALWRKTPRWLRLVAVGCLGVIIVNAIVLSGWMFYSKGLGEIKMFEAKPQKVYLPLAVMNPTPNPVLALKPTPTEEPGLTAYKIQSGDTLYDIARRNDISLELLLAANPGLEETTILHIGDIIYIPPPGTKIGDVASLIKKTATPAQGEAGTDASDTQGTGQEPTPTKKPPVPLAERVSDINGVPIAQIVVLPPEVVENIRNIFAAGQEKGRNAHAFAKIGDSTIESPFFLDRFDTGPYTLGDYNYLQKVINYFTGSFARQGPAVQRGLHAWSLFDPMWADQVACMPGESPVECEFRLTNPAFVFVRLGSNDVGRDVLFTSSLKQLIELSLRKGIIPILGTKADPNDGDDENNRIIRDLAADYDLPLWDFDRAAQTLPGYGIGPDGVHLTTFYAHDFSLPEALRTGYGVHSLTALMMLYELWRILVRS